MTDDMKGCGSKSHSGPSCRGHEGFCRKGCGDGSLERVTGDCYQQRGAYKSPGSSKNGREERRVNAMEIRDDASNVIVKQDADASNVTLLGIEMFKILKRHLVRKP